MPLLESTDCPFSSQLGVFWFSACLVVSRILDIASIVKEPLGLDTMDNSMLFWYGVPLSGLRHKVLASFLWCYDLNMECVPQVPMLRVLSWWLLFWRWGLFGGSRLTECMSLKAILTWPLPFALLPGHHVVSTLAPPSLCPASPFHRHTNIESTVPRLKARDLWAKASLLNENEFYALAKL